MTNIEFLAANQQRRTVTIETATYYSVHAAYIQARSKLGAIDRITVEAKGTVRRILDAEWLAVRLDGADAEATSASAAIEFLFS